MAIRVGWFIWAKKEADTERALLVVRAHPPAASRMHVIASLTHSSLFPVLVVGNSILYFIPSELHIVDLHKDHPRVANVCRSL